MDEYQNSQPTPQPAPQPAPQPVYQTAEPPLPPQYKPLGAWAYFGYSLLFAIPIVGFILLIVFSCSSANINRRNFARSYWCALLIAAIIFVIYLIIVLAAGGSIASAFNNINYYR